LRVFRPKTGICFGRPWLSPLVVLGIPPRTERAQSTQRNTSGKVDFNDRSDKII
jgi:hypothetical protein